MVGLDRFLRFPVVFATVVLIFFVLSVWQNLLIPLVIAIVLWYLIITLANAVSKVPFIGPRLPKIFCFLGAFALCFGAAWLVIVVIRSNINNLVQVLPGYQERLTGLAHSGFRLAGYTQPPDLSDIFGRLDLVTLATGLATLARTVAQNAGVIVIYVIFLLLEYHSFDMKLAALIPNPEKLSSARELVQKIASQIQTYVRLKTLTSLLTATSSYIVLALVGVDFADFWALLIFVLNYIPTIGSIIATTFPCILTLLQFPSFTPFIIVTSSLCALQFYIGNILEPRWMGATFNLSGLVIILSLAVWGQVWGVVGMFLCVPIMVITNIIFANFEATRPIAVLLSREGYVRE